MSRDQGAYRASTVLAGLALAGLALPVAVGSAAGAVLGAALLPFAPANLLKPLLDGVLAISAAKLVRKTRRRPSPAT